jgi:hypothetical protein
MISGVVANGILYGWLEGFSIYLAIILIVSVTSGNDWAKDKQFVMLQSELKNEEITVLRGKYGST